MNTGLVGDFFIRLLVSPALLGCIFLGVGYIFLKSPPRRINWIYGYRTKKSMQNQDTWGEANAFSGRLMLRLGQLSILIGIGISLIFSNVMITGVGSIIVSVVAGTLLIFKTERHLNKLFDEKGVRRI